MPSGPTRRVVKPVKEAAPKAERKRRPRVERTVYEIASQYSGPSTGMNARRSLTALPSSVFGSNPDYVLTPRTEAVAKSLKAEFGSRPFARGNIDAGILKYLAMKGHLKHVGGDLSTEQATLQFTPAAMRYSYGATAAPAKKAGKKPASA
jgi:hypothetical protein